MFPDSANNTFEPGVVLDGKWVILEFIGKGGMGEVYRAHQLNLNRDVAIKVISREFVKSMEDDTEAMVTSLDRFRREVQMMAQIRHPNVLQIFDYGSVIAEGGGEEAALEYIAMEYVPGGTLRSTMSVEGFYPEEERTKEWIEKYFLPLLDGVRALHEAGIVHRDLKPENILLDGTTPKIADFGLARSSKLKPFTQSMDIKGTPQYMSPEHFFDLKRTDERTDVFALGKILFEAIAGKMSPEQIPFRKSSLPEAKTPLFQDLDRIIQQATAEERKERLASVEAMKQALVDAIGKEAPVFTGTEAAPQRSGRLWRNAFIGMIVIFALAGMAGLGIMFFHETGDRPGPSVPASPPSSVQEQTFEMEPEARASVPLGNPPAPTIQGRDGATLYLVPGGRATLPIVLGAQNGVVADVAPFYMDQTKVTNQQYVEFLNKVLSRIKLENEIVKGDGKIWVLLGEVEPGCDPIGFRDGRFYVKEAPHSACPVLRVTASGAAAYAAFYGKRLPTETEWLRALGETDKEKLPENSAGRSAGSPYWMMDDQECSLPSSPITDEAKNGHNLPVCSPVGLFKANEYGLQGLNKGGEWGIRKLSEGLENRNERAVFVVLGGSERKEGGPISVQRHPWEAFEEVGFRCVVSTT